MIQQLHEDDGSMILSYAFCYLFEMLDYASRNSRFIPFITFFFSFFFEKRKKRKGTKVEEKIEMGKDIPCQDCM